MILINVHYPAEGKRGQGDDMFVVMKVAEMLTTPLNLVLLVLLAAAVLMGYGRVLWGRRLVLAAVVFLVLVGVLPWGAWLLVPLENRIPPPSALPAQVDGIVVLGGAIDPVLSAERRQPALNDATERLTAMVQLGRLYPQARLIYSGGSGSVTRQDAKEAPVARELLEAMGFDCSRVVFEDQSRNTRENAVLSHEVARPQPGQTWLLVTSAAHMPRSLGTFRTAGWRIQPYPVDYTTGNHPSWGIGIGPGLNVLSRGMHEWGGLLYYRLRGWTDTLYPGL